MHRMNDTADIHSERRGEVAWIRLNRPDRMNAYDAASGVFL
jgi:2-ketocyclohexanecarboxyl-CoA hydrolase